MIYFDNAATSWPKPEGVIEAMAAFSREVGANPGRAGHRMSVEAGRIVNDARDAVAELLHVNDPLRVVLGSNATEALNLAIFGLLGSGDHVVTSGMEHNSVMRPLRQLEAIGVELTVVECAADGSMDPYDVDAAIRQETRLVVLNHASNVVGTLLPVSDVGAICRENDALLLVDAAQTAGTHPVHMDDDNIDLIAFTGHKGMMGPQGTGGLVIGERVNIADLRPLKHGGTGSRSELEVQPDFLPDRYESGTMNTIGLAGLIAGIEYVLQKGVEAIREHESSLLARFIDGARTIPGATLYGPMDTARQTATTSLNIDGLSQSEAGLMLDEEHNIMSRVGLHCSPSAHRTLGTFPDGTVRFGFGLFNTAEEIDISLEALENMAEGARTSGGGR